VRALGVMDEAAHPFALVVDDEEILRLFAAGLLEEHGFDVMGPRTRQRRLGYSSPIATCGYFSPTFKCSGR
jgi:hypothetical protein